MRKSYTAVPIDKPNPVTGDLKYWVPYLKVRPSKGHVMRAPILAIVDSGSPYCLFRDDVATSIGIRDITTGTPFDFGSVKKGVRGTAYFHKIVLYIESDWKIDVMAGFSTTLSVPALLGRYGFFDRFLVTFDHSGNPPALEVTKIDRLA